MGNLSKQSENVDNFETIWNNANGIAIIEASTREILRLNPAAVFLFGGPEDKLIGQPCHKLFCPIHQCPILENNQKTNRSEHSFMKANGEIIPIIKYVTKIEYGGRAALMESFIDISSVKDSMAKAEQTRLEEANDQAKRAKKEFLAAISHEIRTPMNAIVGMVEIAKNSGNLCELKYCLDKISDSGAHMFEVINNFFDISDIDEDKFEFESALIDVEKMLINICNILKNKMEAKNIKLSVVLAGDTGLSYFGDERRISQVIICLLSNAIKFTAIGSKVIVTAQGEAQPGENFGMLRFIVKDSGIGMTDEQMERIWGEFDQAESDTFQKFGGLGIGLSIAKRIVEKMGGKIWAQSEIGKGSTFHFEVRLERTERQNIPALAKNIRPGDIKILVIDGDRESLDYFAAIIKSFGMNADAAETAEQAESFVELANAEGHPYEIIFSDYGSSGLDGIAALRKIKPSLDKNTFVVLTAPSSKLGKIERFARNIGVGHFISKPLFPSLVLDLVNEIVGDSDKQLGEPGQ